MVRFFSFILPLFFMLAGCALNGSDRVPAGHFSSVTVETSGEVYSEEGGKNSQIDLFGRCLPDQVVVYVEVDGKMTAANCRRGRYTLSLNLPKSFFKEKKRRRGPSSQEQTVKEISVFHRGRDDSKVTSYLFVDPSKGQVVIKKNKN